VRSLTTCARKPRQRVLGNGGGRRSGALHAGILRALCGWRVHAVCGGGTRGAARAPRAPEEGKVLMVVEFEVPSIALQQHLCRTRNSGAGRWNVPRRGVETFPEHDKKPYSHRLSDVRGTVLEPLRKPKEAF